MAIRKSSMSGTPSGNTASRPANPEIGATYNNGTLGVEEIYTSAGWVAKSAPAAIPLNIIATDQGSARAYNNGQASVAFSSGEGGGLVIDYVVTPSPATSPTTFTGSSSPITVTGLQTSQQYTYTVQARNNFGTSLSSSASAAVAATTVPQAPTIGTATTNNSNTDVVVTWTLGNNGGKNLTSITITPYLNGTTAQTPRTAATASSTSYTFTGASALTAGNTYTFKVKQTNDNGDSLESSASNSVLVPLLFNMDYLIVSGGGGSTGNIGGGGGGGGGIISNTGVSVQTGTYNLTIGAGGTQNYNTNGNTGATSSLGSYTIPGGGIGGNSINNSQGRGGTSGSPQSRVGGNGATGSYSERGGGGGGAGANGGDALSDSGGNGGNGLTNSITGVSTYYAGGGAGGGARDRVNGQGGLGGGGGGGSYSNFQSTMNGTANSGGGGGAGSATNGGNGGSGVIIIKIPDTRTATFSAGITSSGGSASGGFKTYTVTSGTGTVTFS